MSKHAGEAVRVGILDNDACALEFITGLVQRHYARLSMQVTIRASMFPTEMLRACTYTESVPNVLLLDMSLNGVGGLDIAQQLRVRAPHMRIIGMTAYDVELYRRDPDSAVLDELLDKSTLRATLPALLPRIIPSISEDALTQTDCCAQTERERRFAALSHKELEVVMMSANRVGNRQIARRLGIEEATVFSYRRNIKRKLNCEDWYDVLDLYRS
ncbi:sigma-70, region 4 [Bifidobacterium pseudolongum subsp. globosum]|uniref:Sigma-70, region 4 n=1 Tax=Bifidobacterium pseudolongum subsp. globosum TaxID=1690 RepID=A0A4V1Y1T4_9BIFI|nr:LuxR C-terminal-related transcriptional regulator [Bifidobacterium pseudolongum]RYQ10979.1 sigma-70, region 4 [Bifidobacterium pseudolongum subsp. globosum]